MSAVEIPLRSHFVRDTYYIEHFYFSRRSMKLVPPQSDDCTPPASETKIRTKNLRKKATRVEFRDTDEQSSGVIDIFALRGKITRYNGDKLFRTLPFLRLSLSRRETSNNFYFRVERMKLPQSSPSGPGQSSRWPQERMHFEFGSNEIYRCNVTGSDNLSEYDPSEINSMNFVKFLIHHLVTYVIAVIVCVTWKTRHTV